MTLTSERPYQQMLKLDLLVAESLFGQCVTSRDGPTMVTTGSIMISSSGGFSHGSMGSMEPPFLAYRMKIYIQADPL